ncbi:MAG TPA: hypothetical protein DEW46_01615 [Verrucomicrobia bacterium]|nr:hypothetical protein [Verrucomicrobiota bacterium]
MIRVPQQRLPESQAGFRLQHLQLAHLAGLHTLLIVGKDLLGDFDRLLTQAFLLLGQEEVPIRGLRLSDDLHHPTAEVLSGNAILGLRDLESGTRDACARIAQQRLIHGQPHKRIVLLVPIGADPELVGQVVRDLQELVAKIVLGARSQEPLQGERPLVVVLFVDGNVLADRLLSGVLSLGFRMPPPDDQVRLERTTL